MVAAGKKRRRYSVAACASCLLLQHATALLLHRPGGAAGSPGVFRGFIGGGLSQGWCGVQQRRERASSALSGRVGEGGGIQRTTPTMIFDFFDQRARSQVFTPRSRLGTAVLVEQSGIIYFAVENQGVKQCGETPRIMWKSYVEYHPRPPKFPSKPSTPVPPPLARSALFSQLADRTYASDPSLFRDVDTLGKCSSLTDPVIFSDRSALSPSTRGVSKYRMFTTRRCMLPRTFEVPV